MNNSPSITRRSQGQEKRETFRQYLHKQSEITSVSYEKAAAYANLIMLGGYAGYFGLWQITKEYLTKSQALWSALLMLVSLVCFVGWEVANMFATHRSIVKRYDLLDAQTINSDPIGTMDKLEEIQRVTQQGTLSYRIWEIIVGMSVLTALCSACVLGYAFIYGLLS